MSDSKQDNNSIQDNENNFSEDIYEVKPTERNWVGKLFFHIGSFLTRTFLDFDIRGQENLPESGPYILAPNHETYVDGLFVAMGLPEEHFERFTALAAKEFLNEKGLSGKIVMRVGRGIPIDRKGSPVDALKVCINQLNQGNILLIHPEGTRTPDGKLGIIKRGSCFVSKHAKVPIVPVFIDGGYEIWSRHMKYPSLWKAPFKPKKLIITYGEPLYPENYKNDREMTKALSKWLHTMYDNKEVERVYEYENLKYMKNLKRRLQRISLKNKDKKKSQQSKEDSDEKKS